MSKAYFWPIALVVMGLVILASRLDMIPQDYADLWPVILVVVGLGGLLTADRKEWLTKTSKASVGKIKKTVRKTGKKKTR